MNEMDELTSFFIHVIEVLEEVGISYMVVGGYAALFYGEPRMTLDVDIVVDMSAAHVPQFVAAFPESGYYVSEEAILDSLARCYPFNVIESRTAAKVDLVPLPQDVFTRMAFTRRQRVEYVAGHSATFIAPEDAIVAKLVAHKNTGSDKHLRDAQGMLRVQGDRLNMTLVRRASRASEVLDVLERITEAGSIGRNDSTAKVE
ncbi:MAG: hypothetical protein ACK2U9_26340 [Anaerolineae bacterium]|jgi:hypothetical protein